MFSFPKHLQKATKVIEKTNLPTYKTKNLKHFWNTINKYKQTNTTSYWELGYTKLFIILLSNFAQTKNLLFLGTEHGVLQSAGC